MLVLTLLPLALLALPALVGWIKLISPGPCFFRQTRIGRGGRPFTMYKLRTMRPGCDETAHQGHILHLIRHNQPMTKLDCDDARLIRGGLFLRMSGLDELPQLLNILRGEMSLVGPRPCIPSEAPLYGTDYRRRFSVQPGLTGLWQVERIKLKTFREMASLDLLYVDQLSLWLDLKIILRTPATLVMQLRTCAKTRRRKADTRFAGTDIQVQGNTATVHLH